MDRRLTACLMCLLIAAGCAMAQTNRILLDEHFDKLDPAAWVPATNGRFQVGEPHFYEIATLEGRSVLIMESDLNGPERRGFLTADAFRIRDALVEVVFRPLSAEEAPLEFWILFPYGDAMIATSLYGDADGSFMRVETTSTVHPVGPAAPFPLGEWLTMRFDITHESFRAELAEEGGETLWAASYPWPLCAIAGEWGLGVLQYAGSSAMQVRAAVDRVTITARCGADIDGDGALTGGDYARFMLHFSAFDCAADMNDDRRLTIDDAVIFTQAFAAGCR